MGPADGGARAETYTHGHHESVLRSHRWRTVENSAPHLLPLLAPGQSLLDVGCGPGTITVDLAARVAPGRVVGVDPVAEVLEVARAERARAGLDNLELVVGDVYHLDFAEESFDVVHAHQVLQHLTDPVAALREMRRVLRRSGVLAIRDSDHAGFVWAPPDPRLDRWMELHHLVTARNGAEADAGRHLLGWAHAAGFAEVQAGSSTWTFADAATRAWWGGLWADRVRYSFFAEQAVGHGFSTREELDDIADAWLQWAAHPDGYMALLHGELIARR